MDALIGQIQDILTPAQDQAIQDKQLTRQSMLEVLQASGVGPSANTGGEIQNTPAAGQDPAGGAPPDAGDFLGGGIGDNGITGGGPGFTSSTQGTPDATARAGLNAQFPYMNPLLVQAVINYLEAKIQG